jgi:hypothetical protein
MPQREEDATKPDTSCRVPGGYTPSHCRQYSTLSSQPRSVSLVAPELFLRKNERKEELAKFLWSFGFDIGG